MTHDSNVGSSATNKIIWRIIPFICILYMFNIIDRANVGFARLTMNRDVGITEAVIDWGYGLFYLGYLGPLFLFPLYSPLFLLPPLVCLCSPPSTGFCSSV